MELKLLEPIYECRCNGRLQTKIFTRLTHTGSVVELEHLKIKTRLTNEKFGPSECEGWVWDLDAIGAPSIFKLIRKAAALARARLTLFLMRCENAARRKWNWSRSDCDGTPEAANKRSVSRWACKNKSLTNSLCNRSDLLAITGINDTALGGLLL